MERGSRKAMRWFLRILFGFSLIWLLVSVTKTIFILSLKEVRSTIISVNKGAFVPDSEKHGLGLWEPNTLIDFVYQWHETEYQGRRFVYEDLQPKFSWPLGELPKPGCAGDFCQGGGMSIWVSPIMPRQYRFTDQKRKIPFWEIVFALIFSGVLGWYGWKKNAV